MINTHADDRFCCSDAINNECVMHVQNFIVMRSCTDRKETFLQFCLTKKLNLRGVCCRLSRQKREPQGEDRACEHQTQRRRRVERLAHPVGQRWESLDQLVAMDESPSERLRMAGRLWGNEPHAERVIPTLSLSKGRNLLRLLFRSPQTAARADPSPFAAPRVSRPHLTLRALPPCRG